jgi:diguanylate cyclase
MAHLEPTPENYQRAYLEEAGETSRPALPAPALSLFERLAVESLEAVGPAAHAKLSQALAGGRWDEASHLLDDYVPRCRETRAAGAASLIEVVTHGLERPNRHWSPARKKDSLQRVLKGSRADVQHLNKRLRQLVGSWDEQPNERGAEEGAVRIDKPDVATPIAASNVHAQVEQVQQGMRVLDERQTPAAFQHEQPKPDETAPVWSRLLISLGNAAQQGLPADDVRCAALASEIAALTTRITIEGPSSELARELDKLCERAQKMLQHRHHMLEQLGKLCHELTAGLTDLSEDASWARGQCDAMRLKLEEGLTPRGVRAVSGLLKATRARQLQLRQEREAARTALRTLVNHMLHELDDLGAHTGRFHESVGRYADVIEQADSLEGLANVVRDMADESRSVKNLMTATQQRLHSEHQSATSLSARVNELESELRRLSEEVSTDQLTQIANRRGLHQAFTAERARAERSGRPLAIGLIDVDDFKKLNDKLGHGAGDDALKALAVKVRDGLRPTDTVARFGGEEFVVLLPETDPDAAVAVLTRLQRSLTAGLFMHNNEQVFVTFSAGVSAFRVGEPLEDTLDRADEALYEAKRTGKNRTCIS